MLLFMINAVCNDVYSDIQVSCDELSSAIDYLDINKSCGLDGIYAEHLIGFILIG